MYKMEVASHAQKCIVMVFVANVFYIGDHFTNID